MKVVDHGLTLWTSHDTEQTRTGILALAGSQIRMLSPLVETRNAASFMATAVSALTGPAATGSIVRMFSRLNAVRLSLCS